MNKALIPLDCPTILNGIYLLKNLKKGTQITVAIKTQRTHNESFLPGRRLIYFKFPDGILKNVGVLNPNYTIGVWSRHKGTELERLIQWVWKALNSEKHPEDLQIDHTTLCLRCNTGCENTFCPKCFVEEMGLSEL